GDCGMNVNTDECWIWPGPRTVNGYGRKGGALAHRVVYEAVTGPIPRGMLLHHICQNKLCVNPKHLKLEIDQAAHGADHRNLKTHCVNGHEYTPENSYYTPSGIRRCRECHRKRERERATALRTLKAELALDLEAFEGEGYFMQAGRVRKALADTNALGRVLSDDGRQT
ncbi:MAG: HNH endonuclease, partial [Armatimonadetes bacterium]|nr:HNH endonuclease [Armatimonadota bacterium]